MKKFQSLFILFLFVFTSINSQVTFVVNELPSDHNFEDNIYISGDFEGWTGGNESFKLKKSDKTYSITLPESEDAILFKFTRGSWNKVERDKNGAQIDNRLHKFTKKNDTIFVKIVSWIPADPTKKSTAAKNVTVVSETFKIPQLNRERRVSIYLPPGYKKSKEKYPVLYMHDAQNLFDKQTSYAGEWEVDETLNKLFSAYNFKLIVVGIDNGGDHRMNEYSPWKNPEFGNPEGKEYVEFIVKNLKPYIDNTYKTLSDRDNTGIMGSSMGGLISYYAALKFSDVFGKAGVYSPSFWFAKDNAIELTKSSGKLQNTKMYFLVGDKEGYNPNTKISSMLTDMNYMIDVLKKEGFSKENIKSKIIPEGEHNEELWRNNFEEAVLWMFPNAKKEVRSFISSEKTNNKLNIKVSDGVYNLHFFNKEIIETTFIPTGQNFKKESHAVVLKPEKITTKFSETNNTILFSSDGISVNIQKKPFKISYLYKGKEVTSESNGYRKIDDLETIQFKLTNDEVLYGGGARALGMNRRGNRLQLYNKADYGYETRSELMNFTMPLVLSSKKYVIHFDNAPIGYLDLDSQQNNTLSYETISGRKTYQVVVGDSWLDLIDNYTDLTGKQPMLPRWALGNFSSRFGYHSQKETENTIQKFKEEKIPVDAVILDLYWFGKKIKGTMGNLEANKDSFPDLKGMISKFQKNGVQTVLITEPFIVDKSNKFKEAIQKDILAKDSIGNVALYDFYFGNTGIIDIYKPEAKQWFWNIYKELVDIGATGVWGDLGEPEVHPSWVQHHTGTADEVHNIYGHDWARLVYEGYQKDFPNQRPFILMRAGYSGSQRFGMVPWSGDVNRTWGGLQSQPEIALQMGMQGLGFMHSDLGGFAGTNLDDELYVRWLQYGVFQPIYRPHAQEEVASEPVFRSEKAKKLAKQAIQLRYKLLPYNYDLAFQNHTTGAPLMRPLFFEEPTNKQLNSNAKSYLWGKDFLITPVLNPKEKEVEVYFPSNNVWFNFYTDKKIIGGQTKLIKTKENSIPTYVRAGAFITTAKEIQTTKHYNANDLTLHYYHDTTIKNSSRSLYNDNGLTANAFEKGVFEKLFFKSVFKKNCLEFEYTQEVGSNFLSKNRKIDAVVYNTNNAKWVKVNGKKVLFTQKDSKIYFPINWKKNTTVKIKIKF